MANKQAPGQKLRHRPSVCDVVVVLGNCLIAMAPFETRIPQCSDIVFLYGTRIHIHVIVWLESHILWSSYHYHHAWLLCTAGFTPVLC